MPLRINVACGLLLTSVAGCIAETQPHGALAGAQWALPNFSDVLEVSVSNPLARPMNGLATIDLDAARKVAPDFPGTLAIVVEDRHGTRFLPSQVDVGTSGSGHGAFVFAVKLAPHEREQLSIYYSETLREGLPWPKSAHATHSFGYNRATAALESELIGYRIYGGFLLDVQAHRKDETGLFNSLIGFSRISAPSVLGQDVLHVGDTLGLGGIFLRSGDQVFRPPFNTPDYAHRPVKPEEPAYRVLSAGPLRAIIDAQIPRWNIGNDEVALRAIYEIRQGQEDVRCHFWVEPLHLSRTYAVGAGIRNLPQMRKIDEQGLVALEGTQSAQTGAIALGLAYSPQSAQRAGELPTADDKNQIVLFDGLLRAGTPMTGQYAAAAAWQGSGWGDPLSHLEQVLRQEMADPVLQLGPHQRNAQLHELESEPQ